MKWVKPTLAAAVLIIALMLAAVASAGGPPALARWVIAGGGGQAANRELVLRATVGQSVVGTEGGRALALCAGFWCAGLPETSLYLPLVSVGG